VSELWSIATFTDTFPPLLINPKTRMKINGKAILNMTAEGLLKVERKLALVIANMAFH
jgi:hypothetical protein